MSLASADGVESVLSGFLDAFACLDWETFRTYFADDATVFLPLVDHPERATGREAVERLFLGVFDRARAASPGPRYLDLEPRDLLIRRMGDTAIATFHLDDPGILCRRTLVLARADEGWKVIHLHASNLPYPAVGE
jgi:ketosteroid isomerase-like protein